MWLLVRPYPRLFPRQLAQQILVQMPEDDVQFGDSELEVPRRKVSRKEKRK
jgi:hypothetical protein